MAGPSKSLQHLAAGYWSGRFPQDIVGPVQQFLVFKGASADPRPSGLDVARRPIRLEEVQASLNMRQHVAAPLSLRLPRSSERFPCGAGRNDLLSDDL